MDKRMVDFIRALRASGVRISLAETQDAMQGVEHVGVTEKDIFKEAMRASLVKDARNRGAFDYFFPLFFNSGTPPLQNIPDNLTPDQRQQLQDALQAMMGQQQALKQLLQQLINGQPFDSDQLSQMAQQAGLNQADNMRYRNWLERRMERQAGLNNIQELIDALMEQMEQMGMSEEARAELREMLEQNAQGLREQIQQAAGAGIAQQMADQEPQPKDDVLDVPFERLADDEIDQIRAEMRRLAARLRSRAALRQRRAKTGKPDMRRTMRANMRYGGVPLELKHKTRHIKPALVVICDVSTSMRHCAEFLLTLVYELQDQVARTHSYVFNSDMADVSMIFRERDPMAAVQQALAENPPGHYATDLGNSLQTFNHDHLGNVGRRTTVIILGDGRNNYRDPRLDLAQDLMRKSRRLIWFVPEHPSEWGSGDSDMHEYARRAHGTYYVRTLRDLAAAVDAVIADGQ